MTGQDTRLVYRGSVKNIRLVRAPQKRRAGRFLFEFTDDYSVFDYGKMPDIIRGKGSAIAMLTAYLFEELEKPSCWKSLFRAAAAWERLGGEEVRQRLRKSPVGRRLQSEGLATHYLGMLDSRDRCRRFPQLQEPSHRILVEAVPVLRPASVRVDGATLWDYSGIHPGHELFLVPLENVFRLGVPMGSSLLERVQKDPGYAAQLGLDGIPSEGEWLSRPVLEFFTKLEPMDRHLSLEAAMNFSGLGGGLFLELKDLTFLVAAFLYELFRGRGLELWDGKLEFVKVGDRLLLADSITPDELRLTYRGTQISKEPLRQYYRKRDRGFLAVMKALKEEGGASSSIQKEVQRRLGRPPIPLESHFRRAVEEMYESLTNRITGSKVFPAAKDLEAVLEGLAGF